MSQKILCIGEVLWDALPKGLFLGGAPFNVACHLKMLGENVAMVSRVGKDTLGDQVIKRSVQKELNTDYIQFDESHQTGIVEVSLNKSGNASYEIVDPVAWDYINLDDSIKAAADDCGYIVYGTLAQRNEKSRETIEMLRSFGKINVYDVNLRPPYIDREIISASLKDADIVKMNDDEMKTMTEWFGFSKDLREGIIHLASKFSCKAVCITRGAHGSVLYLNEKYSENKGFQVKIKDTVGSGDAFLAALIHGIINEKKNYEILEYANAVGAYVATKNGATPKLQNQKIDKILNRNS